MRRTMTRRFYVGSPNVLDVDIEGNRGYLRLYHEAVEDARRKTAEDGLDRPVVEIKCIVSLAETPRPTKVEEVG